MIFFRPYIFCSVVVLGYRIGLMTSQKQKLKDTTDNNVHCAVLNYVPIYFKVACRRAPLASEGLLGDVI